MLQTANGGVVSEFSRLEIMCPSVRPIERAMREPRMDSQYLCGSDNGLGVLGYRPRAAGVSQKYE
jgi:hypothetical protein